MKTYKSTFAVAAVLAMGCNTDVTGGPKPRPDAPAALSLTLTGAPTAVVDQPFALAVEVRNTGGTTALNVAPTTPAQSGTGMFALLVPPDLGAVDLEPGAAHTFRYVYQASDPGNVSLSVSALGRDAALEAEVQSPSQSLTVVIEGAPLLMVQGITVPARVNVGAEFPVSVVVFNAGQSVASNVAPAEPAAVGSGAVTRVAGPDPVSATLAPGESKTFTLRYRPTAQGSVTFSVSATGQSASGGALTAEPLESELVVVDTPAALTGTLSVPATLSSGQVFTATLVVRNTGTAAALRVAPEPLIPSVMVESGSAGATATASPAAVDIPGGGTVTFTWSFTASGVGRMKLSTLLRGEDANTSAPLTSPPVTSSTSEVLTPSMLAITELSIPGVVGRGQTFTVRMTVKNDGGATLTGVLPSPNPPAAIATGGASATTSSTVTAQTLAPGASTTFTWTFTEGGTGPGELKLRGAAVGTSPQGVVNANPTESNLALVQAPATLLVESVRVPARVSRGQTFAVTVDVKNTGDGPASNVSLALTGTGTGGAAAQLPPAGAPVNLAGGARTSFVVNVTENGSGSGELTFSAVANGQSQTGPIASLARQSSAVVVQTAARLEISSFSLPASAARGGPFALTMTVTNSGEATATAVVPSPQVPTAVVTGGASASTASRPAAVAVLGGTTQTFTWLFTENGTGAGTLAFTGAATGTDLNSGAALTAPGRTTSTMSVETATGCGGAALYSGFGGRSLDGSRVDLVAGTNRLRIKPYATMATELNRALGVTPSRIVGQEGTFNAPGTRWSQEQQLNAVSIYQAFKAAFQGCLTYTSTGAAFANNPTAATANTQCANFQARFWTRAPTAAETTACVNFATGAANNDSNPRRRWAYTCAAVMNAAGALTY